jgi:uncharacterized coiled-coil protein SlyX
LRTQQSKISENEIDKAALQEEKNDELNEKFREQWSEDTGYNDWCEALVQSVRDTATKPKEKKKPWFDYNAAIYSYR